MMLNNTSSSYSVFRILSLNARDKLNSSQHLEMQGSIVISKQQLCDIYLCHDLHCQIIGLYWCS